MLGYAGKILIIDLSTGKTSVEPLKKDYALNYIGGIGLGLRLWLDNTVSGVEPLSPENTLILALGPIGGTMFPTGGNGHAFIAKSPATNGVGEAVSHGAFGAELKHAGYDAIILKGKAEKLVYLWIDDDSVQLLDAEHLMGKSPSETEETIKTDLGDYYVRVTAIGLAGEKLSRIACIINEKTRAAGRTGLGAVMGSKNLKAIAVRGTHDINVAKPEVFMDMVKEYHERMKGPPTQKYRTLGTIENVFINNRLQCLPTRNYNGASFEDAAKISAEVLNENYVAKILACNSCPMRCEHEAIIREGPYKGTLTRIEYDSLWALGPNCGVSHLPSIIKAAELCNFYGVDAQSAGVVVGFAMDCYEKGLLSRKDLEGIEANFGNEDALVQLVEIIGKREGIGNILADGVKAAASKIGKDSERLAQHIKGLEVTGYDLRCLKTAALSAAVSFRGADHSRSNVYTLDMTGKVDRLKAEKGRGKLVKDSEDIYSLIDSLIVCKNAKGTFFKELVEFSKLYSTVTGLETSPEELSLAAERINTLARLINLREGLSRKDDSLPWKVMNVPIPEDGPMQGAVVTQDELDSMLNAYYEARGWNLDGVPKAAKLKELGLEKLSNVTKEEAS